MEGNFLAETLPPPLTPKRLIGRSLQSAGSLPLHLNLYRTILYPIFYLLYPIIHLHLNLNLHRTPPISHILYPISNIPYPISHILSTILIQPPSLPSPEYSPNLIVVSDFKENEFSFWLGRLEEQPQAKSGSALKKIRAQLSDAGSLMGVRESPSWQQSQQSSEERVAVNQAQLADSAKTTFRQLNLPGGF